MDNTMGRYRVLDSILIATKPSGEVARREVYLAYDIQLGTFEVVFKQESVLKGYTFAILERECARVKERGVPMATLPKVVV